MNDIYLSGKIVLSLHSLAQHIHWSIVLLTARYQVFFPMSTRPVPAAAKTLPLHKHAGIEAPLRTGGASCTQGVYAQRADSGRNAVPRSAAYERIVDGEV